MVNHQSGESERQQWYPRLPDGYEQNDRHGQHTPPSYPPWYGMPGNPNHGPQGYPPGQGMPGHWGPGHPPGHGMPGHQPPGHHPPGRPPGYQPPEYHPPGRPPGHQPGQQAPTSPPPSRTPEYPSYRPYAIDPGAIAGCMYRFTYIWTSRRNGFWFYPTFVGRTSVSGYRWNPQRHRWEYAGLDLNRIDSFTCY